LKKYSNIHLKNVESMYWFNPTNGAQTTFYLDDIAFVKKSTPFMPVTKTGPGLTVNVGSNRHPISPDIYGMSSADEALAAELGLPVNRWGGNATTRYNWQNNTSNRVSDWYHKPCPSPILPSHLLGMLTGT